MDDAEFEELKTKFYDKDWYSVDEFKDFIGAILSKQTAENLVKAMENMAAIEDKKIPKEYLVCALATALDATHEKNPNILNKHRWIICKMRHYDKRV